MVYTKYGIRNHWGKDEFFNKCHCDNEITIWIKNKIEPILKPKQIPNMLKT